MEVLAFCVVALGACFVIIDSLCVCLLASVRVLLSLVHVSFECVDIDTAVCRVLCDFDYRMMNDEDEYKVVLR